MEKFIPEFGMFQHVADLIAAEKTSSTPENPRENNFNSNLVISPDKIQRDPGRASKFESFYFNGNFNSLPQFIIDPSLNTNGILIENAEFVSYEGLLSRNYSNAPGLFGAMRAVGDPATFYNQILTTDRIAVAVANSSAVNQRASDDVVEYNGAFAGVVNVGAVAAQYGQVEIFNPPGSGIIVSVDEVNTSSPVFTAVRVHNAALAVAGMAGINKNRGSASIASGLLYSGTNAAAAGTLSELLYGANLNFTIGEAYRLQEGQGVCFDCNTVNTAFTASIKWRELAMSSQTKNVQGHNNRPIYLPPKYGMYFAGNQNTSAVLVINCHYKILAKNEG